MGRARKIEERPMKAKASSGGVAIAGAVAAGACLLLAVFSGEAMAAQQTYSCKGKMIAPVSEPTPEMNLSLSLGDDGKTTFAIDGDQKQDAQITSSNPYQVKFQTDQFVSEFYPYTNNLFVIYKSGKLARLVCTAA
jgi:hypothetical protein